MANKFRQIVEAPSSFFQELIQLVPWLAKLWRTLGQVEEWHEVGSSGEPAFENGWVNYAGAAAFYKDPWGVVHIKGLIKTGTSGTVCFTLPEGYRPSESLLWAIVMNNAFGRLDILSNGYVIPAVGTTQYVSLNVSFRAEQ